MTARLGTVLERDGSVYRVATEQGEIRAILTGKAKRDTARVVVGDRVRLEPEPEGPLHAIVGVEPRTSLLQRRLKVGYGRAARIIDQLQFAGILGPPDGSKPRDVLVGLEDLDRICGPRT